ncbi:MAG: type II secretion system protein GspK [Candidatus Competibacter sp.]|nr:type II secretion system protein GspK [Candidatus Competibacter sp.]
MNVVSGCSRHRIGQRGMVLVIVLWIVALLAVMAGTFAYSMRVETRLAASTVERAQARALAEAGVAYAVAWQLNASAGANRETRSRWPPNGDSHDWRFGEGRLRIEVVDAGGLVNLNAAGPDLLGALLKAAGVDPRNQDRLAAAIQDWRDPDDQPLPGGAESVAYRAAGRPGPKNAPFESVEELRQVLGMTPELEERLAGAVTVFARHAGVNPELAPSRVLLALGLDERSVADYLSARARAAVDGVPPPPLRPGGGVSFFSQDRTNVYHIAVEAETAAGTAARVEAVIDLRGRLADKRPRLLAWREGG